ncbi:MAG TPA: alternative ribosome rescue aminoacyl-tRNA hydrolase ArfB [Salinimicrobium sp.]|nr:alternative ribosome rescue aminoacyl-tRNA hydrolase ArfB [Salinimicrobium sp.]
MDENKLIQEAGYKAVRSSGAGGQHVNKVSSKVELHFFVDTSEAFSEEEKARVLKKLESRLTNNNELILQSDTSRSQHKNKELVTKRFLELIQKALIKPKTRKKTKPTKASKLKRLKEKKITGEKKASRKDPLKE